MVNQKSSKRLLKETRNLEIHQSNNKIRCASMFWHTVTNFNSLFFDHLCKLKFKNNKIYISDGYVIDSVMDVSRCTKAKAIVTELCKQDSSTSTLPSMFGKTLKFPHSIIEDFTIWLDLMIMRIYCFGDAKMLKVSTLKKSLACVRNIKRFLSGRQPGAERLESVLPCGDLKLPVV